MSVYTVRDAALAVNRLDMAASWASDYGTTQIIDGREWSGAEVVGSVIEHVRHAIASHYGVGSWNAAGALGDVSTSEVRSMLIAWGASPFTVQQYAKTIARFVRFGHQDGGSSPARKYRADGSRLAFAD